MAKAVKKEYGNESISSLKGADRVRKRPAVIFGSDGIEGCQHSFFEILSNSIDEAREGYGNKITVTRYSDHSLEVEDHGRGVPLGFNQKEGRYNWELIYCELYAGGKYNNNDGENYEFSLGLNGLGACATQYSSEYMDVTSYREGNKYTLHFEKGENIGGLKEEPATRRQTGTIVKWRPDLDVFTDISITAEYIEGVMRRQAVVNPNIKFVFRNQVGSSFETKEFIYEEGITDYIRELLGEEETISSLQHWQSEAKGKDRADLPEYKTKFSVAFCFCNKLNMAEYYHNSSFLEHGGSPEEAVKIAFRSMFDGFLKQQGKYKQNESKIAYQDIEDCLIIVSSSFSTQTSYENQTKKAITNRFIYEAMADFLKRQLEIYFLEKHDEALKVAEQILVNKRSREESEKTRVDVKKKLSGNLDMANRVQKFVDCATKDISRRELYIVEGDSALGSCKQGRDADFQAIMPVRGKILNCLKADNAQIFKSDIITDLIKVLGCGVELSAKQNKGLSLFSLEALRWNKIIICTDADVDGFQIRTLILTMLYCLTPTLIEKGYVYIAESPLYEITSKEKTYFAYTEAEKTQILSMIGDQKFTIQRSKGLGENEADMMWLTTMNPETRRLIKVNPEDAKKTAEIFDLLLGDNLVGRKELIANEGYKYIDLSDIS
ncbi:MAG: DNA topoisomerase [Oscillospiraceae bacterium]|nr:DNA topoisomerase [Oscillospiraceae bacterium]